MAHVIVMPSPGHSMKEGSIQEWFVKEGEAVKPGDHLLTTIWDKAILEVESEHSGVLTKILKTEDDGDIPCGTPIGIIGETGESLVDSRQSSVVSGKAAEAYAQAGSVAPDWIIKYMRKKCHS